jgi:hypothetical protein
VIAQQRRPGAGLADLLDGTAHVEIDQIRAGVRDHGGRLAHDRRVVAEQLDGDRVLVRMDAQELLDGALVAIGEAEAGDHLRGDEGGPEATRLKAHEPVADAGQRSEDEPVLERPSAKGPGVGERGHSRWKR